MTDDKDPEDKPSFFDSADEAKSWPPSEGYELEESDIPDSIINASSNKEDGYEPDALDELLAAEPTKPVVEPVPDMVSTDYMDMLMHDFSNFDGKEKTTDDSEEEFLVPVNKEVIPEPEPEIIEEPEPEPEEEVLVEPEPEPIIFAQDTDKVKIVDDEDEDDEALSDIFTNNVVKKAPAKKETPVNNNDDDFDLDKYVQEKTATPQNTKKEESKDLDYITVPPPITDSEDSNGIYYDFESEPEEESKPFRTYSSLDHGEELTEATEEATGPLAGVNRNVLILGGIIIAIVVYFLFNTIFKPKTDYIARQRAKRPVKEKRLLIEDKELVPLWEVSTQKSRNDSEERQLVQTIYKSSGRDNPFAMPASILADLQKAAELELIKKQKPDTYRRLAYRATLVGVLTSNDNTIALVNQQEASFDVLEGTSRNKILKLAIKAMDKAKRDTQEMVVGSYIGPWVITKIASPESAFSDAKVYIEYRGDKKILNMGKAEELGIFTEGGEIDSLDSSSSDLNDDIDDFEL